MPSSASPSAGQIPNFVAVNFVSYGDVFDVVDTLNGVSS